MSYFLKDQEKWKNLKKYFTWLNEDILNNSAKESHQYNYSKIYLEEPNKPSEIRERILILPEEIIEKEDILPHIWYPRDKFDQNPFDYILMEKSFDNEITFYKNSDSNKTISRDTEYFKYITR